MVFALATTLVFVSLLVTLFYGVAKTAVWVFLPTALFLYCMPAIALPGVPDVSSLSAIGYAIAIALAFQRDELARLRFNLLDGLMFAILGAVIVSVVLSEGAWGGVSASGKEFFVWILPYYLGRLIILDAEARRDALKVLCVSAIVLGCFAAVEARLMPFVYSRELEHTGLVRVTNQMVFYRYGFSRAQVSTPHPIDLGNVGVLLGAMILLLAPMNGRKWYQPLPLFGLLGAGMMVGGAISFTCYLALAAAFGFYFVFKNRAMGRYAVLPAALAIVGFGIVATTYLLAYDTATKQEEGGIAASLWMRATIVQDSWKIATQSGLFGYGKDLPGDQIGVGSVDNAYMLFIMRRGWVYVGLWAALGLTVAVKGVRALARTRTPSERLPVAAGLAGIMATLVAMYTVWYGFLYAQMFVIMLGLFSSMTQLLATRDQPALLPARGPRDYAPTGMRMPAGGAMARGNAARATANGASSGDLRNGHLMNGGAMNGGAISSGAMARGAGGRGLL